MESGETGDLTRKLKGMNKSEPDSVACVARSALRYLPLPLVLQVCLPSNGAGGLRLLAGLLCDPDERRRGGVSGQLQAAHAAPEEVRSS